MVVRQPGAAPLTLYCWVPGTTSLADLSSSAVKTSQNGRWKSVLTRAKNGSRIPDVGERTPLSDEAKAFEAEELAPAQLGNRASSPTSATRNDDCVDVSAEIKYYWDEGDMWITVTISFTDCDAGGGGDVFAWVIDHGYDDPPHVVVDASAYEVMALDSVTFTAEVVSDVHLQPIGWSWAPSNGASWDPWTQACAGTATTCKIQLHGGGKMYYTVQDNASNNITSFVRVIVDLPADAGDDDGDSPFDTAVDTGSVPSTAVTATESQSILSFAKGTGEWSYTQGCAGCKLPHGSPPGPNWEPAVDRPNHIGDCTDFVWWAIRNTLTSTAWPFQKIATWEYLTLYDSTAKLAKNGYVLVDSASVRAGDVILRGRAPRGSGHAGLFMGWAAGPGGGYPIGWANNGTPATDTTSRYDGDTGRFHFKVKTGYVTRFFRPIKKP